MDTLRHLIPSLNGLVVFEAAGRLASFSAAGRELGMSQAAVSHAIARLEGDLGAALFLRQHRRVALTEAGQRFHADVTLGLSHIRRSAEGMRAAATGSHVTLACSTAFAAFWMVPRMAAFRQALPDIDLRIQTSDRDLDLQGEGTPLAVRGGRPEAWPDLLAAPLAPEVIYPVCSPAHLERFAPPAGARELLAHPLIHLEEPFRSATTWKDWFLAEGIAPVALAQGLRINDYVLVIQSVIEGQGVALGWHHLVEGLVRKGVLVRLTDRSVTTGLDFHVIWPRSAPLSKPAQQVRDWLLSQGSAER